MDLQRDVRGQINWPFPVDYERTDHLEADVLVIGAGAAGSSAGIAAARSGVRVIVCEKGAAMRAGNCGAGIDHFTDIADAPGSETTDEKLAAGKLSVNSGMIGVAGPAQVNRNYIASRGTWDALMRLEQMGLPVRDVDGDFEGSPTRDEDSGLMKAYNYRSWDTIKLRGGNFVIPVLNRELRKSGATVLERVMITRLLTEGGRQGARIVGACGFSTETGQFYVFHVKAVILASGYMCGNWTFSTELTGSSYRWDPNDTGDGFTMAYLAGAKTHSFWSNGAAAGSHPFAWPRFGVGASGNTWTPCTIVDNNGKEVPWVYPSGETAETIEERVSYDGPAPKIPQNLMDAVKRGEYELPFWADLSSLPDRERRGIWGMMMGNEGKTRYTVYDYYTRCGFNPEKHMLMCPIDPERGLGSMHGNNGEVKPWRSERGGQGELVLDWDLSTSIPGLYAAGAAGGLEGCSFACSSGDYAGRHAAEYAYAHSWGEISEAQLGKEHDRVYAPVRRYGRKDAHISWKELWGGTARVMQQCCGAYLSPSTISLGLEWMESIRRNEAQMTYARNPHELARVMECENRIESGELYMHACQAMLDAEQETPDIVEYKTKTGPMASLGPLPVLNKFLFGWLEDGRFRSEIKEPDYYLKEDNLPSCRENYDLHNRQDKEEQL